MARRRQRTGREIFDFRVSIFDCSYSTFDTRKSAFASHAHQLPNRSGDGFRLGLDVFQDEMARFDFGQIEDVIDDKGELIAIANEDVDIIGVFLGGKTWITQQIRKSYHRSQWRANFMGHVR